MSNVPVLLKVAPLLSSRSPVPVQVAVPALLKLPPFIVLVLVPIKLNCAPDAMLTAPAPLIETVPSLQSIRWFTFTVFTPLSVPPFKLKESTDAVEPKFKLPAEILTCPDIEPFNAPFNAVLPPETVSKPLNDVISDTVKEPPETFSELPALMVNAAMASVPIECVTAKPVLSNTESKEPGNMPPLQFPGIAQSRPPLVLVKVIVLPPA